MNKWIFLLGIIVALEAQAASTEFEQLDTAFNKKQYWVIGQEIVYTRMIPIGVGLLFT